jgi:hypothetical protein
MAEHVSSWQRVKRFLEGWNFIELVVVVLAVLGALAYWLGARVMELIQGLF